MDEDGLYSLSLRPTINCVEATKDGTGGLYIGDILSRKDEHIDAIISLSDQKLLPMTTATRKVVEYSFFLRDAEDEDDINGEYNYQRAQ